MSESLGNGATISLIKGLAIRSQPNIELLQRHLARRGIHKWVAGEQLLHRVRDCSWSAIVKRIATGGVVGQCPTSVTELPARVVIVVARHKSGKPRNVCFGRLGKGGPHY